MRVERSEVVALLGLGAALALAVLIFARSGRAPAQVAITEPDPPARVGVHVVGEVVWPGLYHLPAGSRIQDAVLAAHGPTHTADLGRINLAAPLRDGDRIVIPRIERPLPPCVPKDPPPPGARSYGGQVRPEARPAGETVSSVNVNTAGAEELERLPGIGPTLARRIVEHRQARGLFRRIEDLLEVKGIGPRLLRRLAPFLRLD